jgi:hypothetical protein
MLLCLQIFVWGFLEHISVVFGLKLSKYKDFSKFETCNHRKNLLIFQLELDTMKCVFILELQQLRSFGTKHFDTIHNSDRCTVIVPVVPHSSHDL